MRSIFKINIAFHAIGQRHSSAYIFKILFGEIYLKKNLKNPMNAVIISYANVIYVRLMFLMLICLSRTYIWWTGFTFLWYVMIICLSALLLEQ